MTTCSLTQSSTTSEGIVAQLFFNFCAVSFFAVWILTGRGRSCGGSLPTPRMVEVVSQSVSEGCEVEEHETRDALGSSRSGSAP